jgi:hypothetical protein
VATWFILKKVNEPSCFQMTEQQLLIIKNITFTETQERNKYIFSRFLFVKLIIYHQIVPEYPFLQNYF